MKKPFRAFVALFLCFSIACSSFAQTEEEGEKKKVSGPRKQLAVIIFAGLGGAILGLSTLSFYGRPQDHLANIAVGFAVGVIGGTVYVTYKAATVPRDFYGASTIPEPTLALRAPVTPILNYQVSF